MAPKRSRSVKRVREIRHLSALGLPSSPFGRGFDEQVVVLSVAQLLCSSGEGVDLFGAKVRDGRKRLFGYQSNSLRNLRVKGALVWDRNGYQQA